MEERTVLLAKYLKELEDADKLKLGTPEATKELFKAIADDLQKIIEIKL